MAQTKATIEVDEPVAVAPHRPAARALMTFLAVAAAVLAADAIGKYFAVQKLTDHAPVRLLGGGLYLDISRNSGAAFSMLTGHTWVFTAVATGVVVWIGWMASRLRSVPWAISLGLVLGGAAGNLADRLFRSPGFPAGNVVDYLSVFGPNAKYFPIFNIADAMLCIGVGLAILLELTGRRRDGTRSERDSAKATD